MFDELSNRLEDALKSLKGQDKITEQNIDPALRDLRRALIEADVNLNVVDEFLLGVRSEAIGVEVVRGILPEQKLIDIVHKKLVEIMGSDNQPLSESQSGATTIMLVGLQGAGKTTGAAKLGLYLKSKGNKVLLVGADTFRPAAKDQLITLATQNGIDVFTGAVNADSKEIVLQGIKKGKQEQYDQIIVDTAGRLYIDDQMMNEVADIKREIEPHEVLLVVDSMIGQEAAQLTRVFNEKIGITGAILTKLDGDSRGGAALSIKKVSGKPIKFIGTGEKVEALEPFYPERLAGRILGMGDILTLVDKAQKEVEINDVLSMQKKFEEASFDFSDFLQQMQLIKRMGSIGGLMKLIPGMNKIDDTTLKAGETQLKRIQSMIGSMTNQEKLDPELLVKSQKRRRRIAHGSGYAEGDVDKMINDFVRMRKMMQGLAKGNLGAIRNSMRQQDGHEKSIGRTENIQRDHSGLNLRKNVKKRKGFFDL